MTKKQLEAVLGQFRYLARNYSVVFHHGDCVGADAEAHVLAKLLGWSIIKHPGRPIGDHARANMIGYEECWTVQPPLTRNIKIVQQSGILIAAPSGTEEQRRGSGTWHAIRQTRDYSAGRLIIYGPNGARLKWSGK